MSHITWYVLGMDARKYRLFAGEQHKGEASERSGALTLSRGSLKSGAGEKAFQEEHR